MLTKKKLKQYSVVKLTDGREGTILEVYDKGVYNGKKLPLAYEIEIDPTNELVAIPHTDIVELLWEPKL